MIQENDPDKKPDPLYDIRYVANWLQTSTKTIKRYVDAGMFENYILVKRPERNRILFPRESLEAFKRKYQIGLPSPERPRRAYNRRQVKGKHKRKSVK